MCEYVRRRSVKMKIRDKTLLFVSIGATVKCAQNRPIRNNSQSALCVTFVWLAKALSVRSCVCWWQILRSLFFYLFLTSQQPAHWPSCDSSHFHFHRINTQLQIVFDNSIISMILFMFAVNFMWKLLVLVARRLFRMNSTRSMLPLLHVICTTTTAAATVSIWLHISLAFLLRYSILLRPCS